jgi:hypothetical protein
VAEVGQVGWFFHADYRTTAKHYIDRKEVAKDMVENGFRVFPIKRPCNSARS